MYKTINEYIENNRKNPINQVDLNSTFRAVLDKNGP